MKKKVFNFVTDYMKAIQYFHKFGFCIFKNIVSDTQLYKQCGNSIVVNMFIELFKAVNFDEII